MFCTLDSRGVRHVRAFRTFRKSSNQSPCLWLSELSSSFRHFRGSCRFREVHRIAKHRSRPPFTGVLRGLGLKVPHGVLFEQFWAPASECPKECFLSAFWRCLAPKTPNSTQKALFAALQGSFPKLLKKHSVGHFQARAPEHSCKWRPELQNIGLAKPRFRNTRRKASIIPPSARTG